MNRVMLSVRACQKPIQVTKCNVNINNPPIQLQSYSNYCTRNYNQQLNLNRKPIQFSPSSSLQQRKPIQFNSLSMATLIQNAPFHTNRRPRPIQFSNTNSNTLLQHRKPMQFNYIINNNNYCHSNNNNNNIRTNSTSKFKETDETYNTSPPNTYTASQILRLL
eukprot:Pgem_evm1s11279